MAKAIVIGVSSGGLNAMKYLFPALPADFSIPIIVVQHISSHSDNHWIALLNSMSMLNVKEADEKEKINPGTIYIAPANYHLLIEEDHTFSFTIDEKVNFARPSIDVLFETAANAYGHQLIGVVLTGANHDGALGLKKIKKMGGLTIVQDPATAEAGHMPASAIKETSPDHILPLEDIAQLLININQQIIQSKK